MATQGWRDNHLNPRDGFAEDYTVSESDEMDDTLVGPVYLRLDDPTFRSYCLYANATFDVEAEEGEDELGLDLSAPPPESWVPLLSLHAPTPASYDFSL